MGSNTDKFQDKIPSGTLGKAKAALLCQSYTQASVWDMRGKWECDSHKDLGCPRVGVVSLTDPGKCPWILEASQDCWDGAWRKLGSWKLSLSTARVELG